MDVPEAAVEATVVLLLLLLLFLLMLLLFCCVLAFDSKPFIHSDRPSPRETISFEEICFLFACLFVACLCHGRARACACSPPLLPLLHVRT